MFFLFSRPLNGQKGPRLGTTVSATPHSAQPPGSWTEKALGVSERLEGAGGGGAGGSWGSAGVQKEFFFFVIFLCEGGYLGTFFFEVIRRREREFCSWKEPRYAIFGHEVVIWH